MELYQLRAFIAVAESGQLTRAADRLHLSQPAVSAQIRALEDLLGQQLFERTSSGMTLTKVGLELLPLVERVLEAADALKKAAFAHGSGPAGRVRIGTLSDPQFIRLGDFLGRAIERYPLIEIELHNEFSGAAFEEVVAGSLDASFFFGDLVHPSVTGLRLGEITYRVAAPAAWTERIRNAGWADIAAMPWIMAPDKSTRYALQATLFREHGVELTKVIEADNESVITNLVESEVGVSLIREDIALERAAAGTVVVWDTARVSTALWFIYQHDRADSPELAALLEVLRETWGLSAVGGMTAPLTRLDTSKSGRVPRLPLRRSTRGRSAKVRTLS